MHICYVSKLKPNEYSASNDLCLIENTVKRKCLVEIFLINYILLCFGSDKFGERKNIPKLYENTK